MKTLAKHSIPEKQRRWYVKHIETFIKAQNGNKIKSLSAEDITRYFEALGRQNRLGGWQFAQHINAIQILYCESFALPLCEDVNWQYWLDSARQLDIDHPTTSRQLTPEELTYLKERKGEGPLQDVRKHHREMIVSSLSVKYDAEVTLIKQNKRMNNGFVDTFCFAEINHQRKLEQVK